MKRILTYLLFFGITQTAFPQKNNELSDLRSGFPSSVASFTNSIFTGMASSAVGIGNDYGGLMKKSESVLLNPANLAFVRASQLILYFKPTLSKHDRPVNQTEMLRAAIRNNRTDIGEPNFASEEEELADFEKRAGANVDFRMGSVAFKLKDYIIAAALYEPMRFSFDLLESRFENRKLFFDAEHPDSDFSSISNVDFSASAKLKIHGACIGVGKKVSSNWSVGATIERLTGEIEVLADSRFDKATLMLGKRLFYDAERGEEIQKKSLKNRFFGGSLALRIGSAYKIHRKLRIGAAVVFPHKVEIDGKLKVVRYRLAELNSDTQKAVQSTGEKVEPHGTKHTVAMDSLTSKGFQVQLPGTIGFGLSGRFGFMGFSLNFAHYFGQWSYRYSISDESRVDPVYHALKMQNEARFGFDLKIIRVGLGLGVGRIYDHNFDLKGRRIIVPSVSIATGVWFAKKIYSDILLVSAPSEVMKFSVQYDF